jgi:cytochrome d ubiquinol oxidase subunit II
MLLAFMILAFVLLDGYDLGIGAISRFVARSNAERGELMAIIGPFWNGNEVWLIAAGGALFALFPQAYAVSFSGFYLPFMVVLWLLMFRGISLELRHLMENEMWFALWDSLFAISSALLAVFFGVALGNLLRGVPLDASGYFFGTFAGLLNPFAVGAGLLALAALSLHGAVYAAAHASAPLAKRCTAFAGRLWWAVLVLWAAVSAGAFAIYHAVDARQVLSGLLTLGALGALVFARARLRKPRQAFAGTSVFLALLMSAAVTTLYPYLIPAYPRGSGGLTVDDAAPHAESLAIIIAIVAFGLAALAVYRTIAARGLDRGTPAG